MIRDSFIGALRAKVSGLEKRKQRVLDEPKGLYAQMNTPHDLAIKIRTLKEIIQLAKRYREEE